MNPDGAEACNSLDDNCDGAVDEGFAVETYYRDSDGDTYGDSTDPIVACAPVAGFSATSGDCDDDEYWANPGLSELCDEIDNDCDGVVDEDLVFTDFVPDSDGDGFGDASGPVVTDCIPPAGHVVDTSDCDDGNSAVNPMAVETCNGLDDNCSGTIDEGLPEYTYYLDEDGDGHGLEDSTVTACIVPPGYSELFDDCDDTDDFTYPGAYEFCDGEDDDCNGLVDDDCGYSRNYVMFVTDSFLGSHHPLGRDPRGRERVLRGLCRLIGYRWHELQDCLLDTGRGRSRLPRLRAWDGHGLRLHGALIDDTDSTTGRLRGFGHEDWTIVGSTPTGVSWVLGKLCGRVVADLPVLKKFACGSSSRRLQPLVMLLVGNATHRLYG